MGFKFIFKLLLVFVCKKQGGIDPLSIYFYCFFCKFIEPFLLKQMGGIQIVFEFIISNLAGFRAGFSMSLKP